MSAFVEVARTGDLEEGGMKKVCAGGRELLLAMARGRYYCADNRCPHLGGNLSGGTLEGTIVTCPEHFSRFDLTDGSIIQWTNLTGVVARMDMLTHPPRSLAVYEVKEEEGRVLVRLP